MKSKVLHNSVAGITILMVLFTAIAAMGVAQANIPETAINLSDSGVICGYRTPHPLAGLCPGGATTSPPIQIFGGGGAVTFTGTYFGISDSDPTKEALETQCVLGCPISFNGAYTNIFCTTMIMNGTIVIEGQSFPFTIIVLAGIGVVIPDPSSPIPNSLTESGSGEVMAVTGWPIQEIITGNVLITKALADDAVIPNCISQFDMTAAVDLWDVATPIEI